MTTPPTALPPGAHVGPDGVVRWDRFDDPHGGPPAASGLDAMLGNPRARPGRPSKPYGDLRYDVEWFTDHIVYCHPRGHLAPLPCLKNLTSGAWVGVHRLAEPSLREALRRAELAEPGLRFSSAGCWVFRHQRWGLELPLSVHAWGAALDLDPGKNRARSFPRGNAPGAWTPRWYGLWPDGVSRNVVEAFRSCGWRWGADWDDDDDTADHTYIDPMHFEWTARPAA